MFSTRISLQWVPEPASEATSTYVITAPNDHFVDIRIKKESYPIIQEDNLIAESERVFDWVSSGKESPVEGTEEIKFLLDIDSIEIWDAVQNSKPLSECRREPDLGFFYDIEGSLDRKETGNMVNPNTGSNQDYIEIWRTLDPKKHTPSEEARESKEPQEAITKVLIAELDKLEGKFVRLGNWSQGLLHDKETHKVQVSRSWFNGEKWEHQIAFGPIDFPFDFEGEKGESVEVNGVTWKSLY